MGRWCWLSSGVTADAFGMGNTARTPAWTQKCSAIRMGLNILILQLHCEAGSRAGSHSLLPCFSFSFPFLLHYYSFTAQPVALWAEGLNSSQQSWGHSTLHGPRAPVPHRQGQREAASNDIDISFLIIDTIKSRADYKLLPRHVTLLLALSLLLGQLCQ